MNGDEVIKDFIRNHIEDDLAKKRFSYVKTRYPPEPNGWLHLGHAKALAINFGIACDFHGMCNLRFDDTNPEAESIEYVDAIKKDIAWLGYDWADREFFASDYFGKLYECAIKIIKKGLAYVDDLDEEQIRVYRGTKTEGEITNTPPGKDSPFRTRSIEENLSLFESMKNGAFPDGAKTLRAKIDMAHPNLVMRDPVMYRIRRYPHYRAGTTWCIYPMYDFQHPLSDAFEEITHSLCSLEYEIHRPLYEWFLQAADAFPSRQIEFARLSVSHTVLSKRWLLKLVEGKHVNGWDDPRMPTLAGLRRRGYTPEAIRDFMARIGISKTDSVVDIQFLEHCLRVHLNKKAQRVMVVLDPVELVIENWPKDHIEKIIAINNPEDPEGGSREIDFSGELLIEADDFAESPPPKYFRLYVGNSVRLRYGYIVTCTGFEKDPVSDKVTKVLCTYDPATKGGNAQDNRKVKGTIHWVNKATSVPLEVRQFEHLFAAERPMDVEAGIDWVSTINQASKKVINSARGEASMVEAQPLQAYQFERQGYFCCDQDSTRQLKVFNLSVALRDTWAKIEKKQGDAV